MAVHAVAQETIFGLRQKIAKIEGRLAERLDGPAATPGEARASCCAVTASHRPADFFLPTGVDALDRTLGGGLPKAALTEIHGAETRDAGAVAGFALALAGLILKGNKTGLPLLWIGTSEIFREAGFPYAVGLARDFGIAPEALLFSETRKTRRRTVDRRGGGAAFGTCRRHHRAARQSRKARSHGDPPPASPRPGGGPAGFADPPGGRSRADRRPCPLRRRAGAGRTAHHPCRSARRIDRCARLHGDDRQEPHRADWTIHCGVEQP